MSGLNEADGARGALVENAIHFAKQGDSAQAIGILAGMSDADVALYGDVILSFLPDRARLPRPDPLGNNTLQSAAELLAAVERRYPAP